MNEFFVEIIFPIIYADADDADFLWYLILIKYYNGTNNPCKVNRQKQKLTLKNMHFMNIQTRSKKTMDKIILVRTWFKRRDRLCAKQIHFLMQAPDSKQLVSQLDTAQQLSIKSVQLLTDGSTCPCPTQPTMSRMTYISYLPVSGCRSYYSVINTSVQCSSCWPLYPLENNVGISNVYPRRKK